jgi:hypothetical protein
VRNTSQELARAKACTAFAPPIIDAKKGPIPRANNVSKQVIITDLLYDSIPGASFFDPRDTVLFLRILAWPLLFAVIPWIARRGNGVSFPRWVPSIVRRNWFELVTYGHFTAAWVVLICALYARIEVFFPVTISFGVLLYDRNREWLLHTFRVQILFGLRATTNHYAKLHRSSVNERPTAVELVVRRNPHP